MKHQCEDWGVPDWRDGGGYPKPNELTLDEWRWEFLRRRSDYRTDYMRPEEKFIGESKGRYFERAHKMNYVADPHLSCLDLKTHGEKLGDIYPPYFDIVFLDTSLSSHYGYPWNDEKRPRVEPQPYHIDLRIDLTRPLTPQFNRFRKLAAEAQKSWSKGGKVSRRLRTDKWPLYLRVLDARASGASYSQIAHALLRHKKPTDQGTRDVVKQAEALRDNFPA